MVFGINRAEAVLHDVRGDFYAEFVLVRACAEPGRAGDFPDLAGRGRRGVAAERASDLERHFRAGEAWHGVCGVWARRGCGANHRAVAGRMDYRQLFVEMDFLHQRTGGDHFAGADQLFDQRPAVYEESECESGIPDRLHRHRVDQPGPREHADYSRQGTARGLAVVEFHSRFFRADDFWADRGNPLGIA